jgi:hypothetical protein
MTDSPQHPVQPLITDDDGVTRFKENPIVRYLLETHGSHDLNSLHLIPFDNEHWVQFHQLIGVSLQLFADIDYISDENYHRAAGPEVEKGESG